MVLDSAEEMQVLKRRLVDLDSFVEKSSKQLSRLLKRSLATVVTHEPVDGSIHLALPLVFTSVRSPGQRADEWSDWIAASVQQGYGSLEISLESSQPKLPDLARDLGQALRGSSSPFPPLLFARSMSTLVAQAYVSSNALSGLVLVDPPLSVRSAFAEEEEFNFEPFFPIAMMASTSEVAQQLAQHRLMRDYPEDVELLTAPEAGPPLSKEAFELVLRWMDARRL